MTKRVGILKIKTKNDPKLLMRRMHYWLNTQKWPIKLGWTDTFTFTALCDPEEQIIYINPFLLIVRCFIHEYLHEAYPNMPERKVYKLEAKIYNNLTNREIKNLAKKIMLGRKISLKDFEKIPDP